MDWLERLRTMRRNSGMTAEEISAQALQKKTSRR